VIFQSTQEGDLPWREGQAVDLYPVEYDGKPANIAIRQPINHDPLPWLHDHASENCRDNGSRFTTNNGVGNVWAPRPEFARPPVNGVLAAFRDWGVKTGDPAWALRCFHDAVTTDDFAPEAHREVIREAEAAEIDHARKVLTRLANLEGDKK